MNELGATWRMTGDHWKSEKIQEQYFGREIHIQDNCSYASGRKKDSTGTSNQTEPRALTITISLYQDELIHLFTSR